MSQRIPQEGELLLQTEMGARVERLWETLIPIEQAALPEDSFAAGSLPWHHALRVSGKRMGDAHFPRLVCLLNSFSF